MLQSRPQLRFLLRAGGLLIASLLLWWIVLLDPLLDWTRISGSIVLGLVPGATAGEHVMVKSDGNWLLQVPVPAEAQNRADLQQLAAGGSAAPRRVRSFKMETTRGQVALYTVALPIFLALLFSAGLPLMGWIRSLAIGCGILLLLMPVYLALYAMTTVRIYFKIVSSPPVDFLWGMLSYMNSEVLPYLLPLFLALWLNRALRTQIFSLSPAAVASPEPEAAAPNRKIRKGRASRT